jgi:hypothetical protein
MVQGTGTIMHGSPPPPILSLHLSILIAILLSHCHHAAANAARVRDANSPRVRERRSCTKRRQERGEEEISKGDKYVGGTRGGSRGTPQISGHTVGMQGGAAF